MPCRNNSMSNSADNSHEVNSPCSWNPQPLLPHPTPPSPLCPPPASPGAASVAFGSHALDLPAVTSEDLARPGVSFSICSVPVCHDCHAPPELHLSCPWPVHTPFLPLGLLAGWGAWRETGWPPLPVSS